MGLNILIALDDQPDAALTEQVSRVEVYEKMDENTHFQIRFMIDVCDSDIADTLLNAVSYGRPLSVLVQTDNGLQCLVKGPVLQQNASLQHGGAGSWLDVQGEDTGYFMGREVSFRVTPSGSDSDIVRSLISNYDQLSPDVDDTPASTHDEDNHSHVQRDNDLAIIRNLAQRNGYHFWISYATNGEGTAHFKPRDLQGAPAAELIVNLENNNIDTLQVSADTRRPAQTRGQQINLRTNEVIGDSAVLNDSLLGSEGLSTTASRVTQTVQLAPVVDDAGALDSRSEAALREAQWFINASCSTSIFRLCKLVRFHTVVNLTGAGSRHSGKYYVTAVRHTIDALTHKMDLELARNAWGNEAGAGAGLPPVIF